LHMLGRNRLSQIRGEAMMTESFTERTAGIWLPLIVYAVGGVYMLVLWGIIDTAAYHLLIFGVVSIIIAVALYFMSRWAFWLGLLTFPLFFVDFAYAVNATVNFAGWYPNPATAVFNASIIIYLVFLTFALILLIDRRNVLKGDRVLDLLNRPVAAPEKTEKKTSD
jgi:hypothetical protein